jgi:alkaline phosphatase D
MNKLRFVVSLLCWVLILSPVFAQKETVKPGGSPGQVNKTNPAAKTKTPDQLTEREAPESLEIVDLDAYKPKAIDTTVSLSVISFGSCNKLDKPQTMWNAVAANNPNLWIWLGDIVYADTSNMKVLAGYYKKLKNGPEYKNLRAKAQIVGVYDDHDYGYNDAAGGYPFKKASKKCLLDFLDVPANHVTRKREGAYTSYTFGKPGQKIKVIVLDTRYFRDTLYADPSKQKRYLPNMEGDVLGAAQWKWLEDELRHSTAQVNIIGCGIQYIHEEHAFEKWANFPAARKRFFELLQRVKPSKTVLISGDRHISEVSKIDLPGLGYPLYDFTSSGLTHSYTGSNTESNKYRVSPLVNQRSFGVMRVDWSAPSPKIIMEARGLDNVEFFKIEF